MCEMDHARAFFLLYILKDHTRINNLFKYRASKPINVIRRIVSM